MYINFKRDLETEEICLSVCLFIFINYCLLYKVCVNLYTTDNTAITMSMLVWGIPFLKLLFQNQKAVIF